MNISALEGTYSDKAYGNMTLHVDPSRKNRLIARRPEMTWHYELSFRHVDGDNWIESDSWLENTEKPVDYLPVGFIKGDGGKPSGVKLAWVGADEGFEGNVTLARIG